MERLIEDLLGDLPEPIRSEALEARRKAVERGDNIYSDCHTASDYAEALDGFDWDIDGGDSVKWQAICRRAAAGEFDGPSELDRLRARVAELEGFLHRIDEGSESEDALIREARNLLFNNK